MASTYVYGQREFRLLAGHVVNIDVIETVKAVGAFVAPVLSASGVWAYLRSRAPKMSSPSQITESQADLATAVNLQTVTILAENARLRRDSNQERRSLKRAVAKISAEVAECNGRHQECEERVTHLSGEVTTQAAQIAKLMELNPPAAQYDTLKRVGPKDI